MGFHHREEKTTEKDMVGVLGGETKVLTKEKGLYYILAE